MTSDIRDWLPETAFTPDAVGGALAAPVAAWAERWFVRDVPSVFGARQVLAPLPDPGQTLQVSGAVVIATVSGPARRKLLESVLDIDLADCALGPVDHQLLDVFAREVTTDLVETLDMMLGPKAGSSTHVSEQRLAIGGEGRVMIELSVASHSLVAALKSRALSTPRDRPPVRDRRTALSPTLLTTEAVLGSVRLAMEDLKGLATGDILVLDQSVDDPVRLRLRGRNVPIGNARLARNEDSVALQF